MRPALLASSEASESPRAAALGVVAVIHVLQLAAQTFHRLAKSDVVIAGQAPQGSDVMFG